MSAGKAVLDAEWIERNRERLREALKIAMARRWEDIEGVQIALDAIAENIIRDEIEGYIRLARDLEGGEREARDG